MELKQRINDWTKITKRKSRGAESLFESQQQRLKDLELISTVVPTEEIGEGSVHQNSKNLHIH